MTIERLNIEQDLIRELFGYRDGALHRKNGSKTGTTNSTGRRQISINGKIYKEHRLIFLWHNGWVPFEIDHIDGNPLNNKIENLRVATHSQNGANTARRADNTSGEKGVWWDKRKNKYVIFTHKDGKRLYGTPAYVKDFASAVTAARELRARVHGEFANQ